MPSHMSGAGRAGSYRLLGMGENLGALLQASKFQLFSPVNLAGSRSLPCPPFLPGPALTPQPAFSFSPGPSPLPQKVLLQEPLGVPAPGEAAAAIRHARLPARLLPALLSCHPAACACPGGRQAWAGRGEAGKPPPAFFLPSFSPFSPFFSRLPSSPGRKCFSAVAKPPAQR